MTHSMLTLCFKCKRYRCECAILARNAEVKERRMKNLGRLIRHGWSLTTAHVAGGRIWRRGHFMCILGYDGTLRQCVSAHNAPHHPGWASKPLARMYWRNRRKENGVT